MFKNLLLAAALLVGGTFMMPSQSQAGGPHCGPYGHHGHHGYNSGYRGYGYSAARPIVVPNYGYGTGVPYIGPSVRYGGYGYSSYRPGLNISIGGNPYGGYGGGYGGYGGGSPFGYGSGFGLYLGR